MSCVGRLVLPVFLLFQVLPASKHSASKESEVGAFVQMHGAAQDSDTDETEVRGRARRSGNMFRVIWSSWAQIPVGRGRASLEGRFGEPLSGSFIFSLAVL